MMNCHPRLNVEPDADDMRTLLPPFIACVLAFHLRVPVNHQSAFTLEVRRRRGMWVSFRFR